MQIAVEKWYLLADYVAKATKINVATCSCMIAELARSIQCCHRVVA
jgi:hypothetical protein